MKKFGNDKPPYKVDEAAFLVEIYLRRHAPDAPRKNVSWFGFSVGDAPVVTVRDIVNEWHEAGKMHAKRAYYVLDKFGTWDFYNYGVSLDLGWLEEKGILRAQELIARPFYLAPGSAEAVKAGCTCPIYDNAKGRGAWFTSGPNAQFWYTYGCPLHMPQPPEEAAMLEDAEDEEDPEPAQSRLAVTSAEG